MAIFSSSADTSYSHLNYLFLPPPHLEELPVPTSNPTWAA